MSPLYEYRCRRGHSTDLIRPYDRRIEPVKCPTCGGATEYQFPRSHVEPDGIYSYAPNLGSEADFERRREAIREGKGAIPRSRDV